MIAEKQKVLFQVDVDVDLAKNPKIRNMYKNKNNDMGEDMVMFFFENKINTVDLKIRAGKVARVSLRGEPAGLSKFVNKYFTANETSVVYNLTYK